MADITVQYLYFDKLCGDAVLQITAGGGFADADLSDDIFHCRRHFRLVDKPRLHLFEGNVLNALGVGLVGEIFGLQIIQHIDTVLVDGLEGASSMHKLHEPLQ